MSSLNVGLVTRRKLQFEAFGPSADRSVRKTPGCTSSLLAIIIN